MRAWWPSFPLPRASWHSKKGITFGGVIHPVCQPKKAMRVEDFGEGDPPTVHFISARDVATLGTILRSPLWDTLLMVVRYAIFPFKVACMVVYFFVPAWKVLSFSVHMGILLVAYFFRVVRWVFVLTGPVALVILTGATRFFWDKFCHCVALLMRVLTGYRRTPKPAGIIPMSPHNRAAHPQHSSVIAGTGGLGSRDVGVWSLGSRGYGWLSSQLVLREKKLAAPTN